MKNLRGLSLILGASLLGVGIATLVTNPDRASYETYATRRLTAHLQDEVCPQAGILEDLCDSALRDNQPQIQEFIANNTERENFLFWSIYKTELSAGDLVPGAIRSVVPAYYFETVGVFSSFYTYEAKQI
jgi:hypothetical protein